MDVSISTVRRRMSDAGILIRDYYSTITNSEFDEIVRHVQQKFQCAAIDKCKVI